MEELKLCPFCGARESREEIQNVGGIVFHWHILQHEPWCFLYHLKGEQGITENDVKAWNTRAACYDCQTGVPATEENMAKYGWVKERTCHIETRVIDDIEEDFCTACGNELACYYQPHYCPNCGAKVVE